MMTMPQLVALLAALFFLAMLLISHWNFKVEDPGARKAKRRIGTLAMAGAAVVAWALRYMPAQSAWLHWAASLVLVLALAVLLWSYRTSRSAALRFAFSERPPESLVMTGPYRFVRHPFYSSYLLAWLACGIAAPSMWTALVFLVMLTVYSKAARMEESMFAGTDLATSYASYRLRTPMFIPLVR